jgi:hypothetical protein
MRRNSKLNIEQQKQLAREKYAERQLDRWIKWKWNTHGYIKWNELIEQCKKYNI